MQAKIRNIGDVFVINLIGRIDIETSEPFKRACEKFSHKKVVFNFSQLSFVGSHGIVPFVDALRDLVENQGIEAKFCGMGSEFQRIISASPLQGVEIYEDEGLATSAFRAPLISTAQ